MVSSDWKKIPVRLVELFERTERQQVALAEMRGEMLERMARTDARFRQVQQLFARFSNPAQSQEDQPSGGMDQ